MPRNSVTGETSGTGGGLDQSVTAPVITNGSTIDTSVDISRVAPGGAVTGIILAAGTYPGQRVTVVNESAAASTVTMATAGTSFVADGVTTVIPGLRASTFWWDSAAGRWFRTA